MRESRKLLLLWIFSVSAVMGMYAVAVRFGALNQDEGWYLYAGRLVSEGKKPFVDFASTQGPVMAYVYALAQPAVRLAGVAGGRMFTAVIGFVTLLCAARLAYLIAGDGRFGHGLTTADAGGDAAKDGDAVTGWGSDKNAVGLTAALLVFALLGMNLYYVYFTSIVKTYSLAGLFTVLGFLALCKALCRSGGNREQLLSFVFSFISAGMFALAAGVRLSAGILLPAIWLMLAFGWWRRGHRRDDVFVLTGFLFGGSVVLLSIFIPLLAAAPVAVKFGLLEYHSGRSVGSSAVLLAYKGGFVMRLVGSYFPLVIAAVAGLWGWFARRGKRDESGNQDAGGVIPVMITGLTAVTLVHLAAAFPYDDYQVFIMPVLAVIAGTAVAPVLSRVKFGLLIVVLLLLAHSVSSPMLQGWLLAERDRIWWPLRSETALGRLHRAAESVINFGGYRASKCDTLLTQDTYLAVEAGLHVPQGMELGPFCYFPDMDRDKAQACHVLNWEMFRNVLLAGKSPAAAFSGYGLAISCPQITQLSAEEQKELWKTLESSYEPVATIDAFGQADTTLRILKCLEKE